MKRLGRLYSFVLNPARRDLGDHDSAGVHVGRALLAFGASGILIPASAYLLIVPEGGHANFDAHVRIAKDRDAETGPYRFAVRHSQPELAAHFSGRRQNGAVGLRQMI